MSQTAPPPAEDVPATCENCGTPLRGHYCHACGQSTHSPVRHVGHAVEEVFESFWHLDGRIFRTVRDLFVPGRIAGRYLGGQRVRYVAPMRLFVILTLLTFFVAKFVVQDAMLGFEADGVIQATDMRAQFAQAQTAAEVDAIRDSLIADIDEARRVTGALPGVSTRLSAAESEVRAQARARTAVLAGAAGSDAPAPEPADTEAASADGVTAAPDADGTGPEYRRDAPPLGGRIGARITRNLDRLQDSPGAYSRALLGVAPTALFILVPLFAVLLKLAYLFQRRLYLEHVVIGLYSHAALMLGLLLVFCGALATPWLEARAAWAAGVVGLLQTVLLWAMPVYLLVTQKRVYGQSWPWTLLKFAIIGALYFALFLSVAIPMAGYALYAL
ncbi:hypothetical protein CMZ84_03630 [Lysobacteraceae bacterium NML93-0399]|nr:hypothetical protein CMZ84_03630 [Xanthomonadaceae bacterium NML93-0399]